MKCAIMQPHYFPWPGYFNLMSKVDTFVFLDDAQYSKGSWHNRNLILNKSEKFWLTIPLKNSSSKTKIIDKIVDDKKNWKKNHIKTLMQFYSHHKFINDLQEIINFLDNLSIKNLSELNICLIKFIAGKLKINTKFIKSSSFSIDEKRTTKVIKILEKIGAKEYLSPIGSKEYLQKDSFDRGTTIALKFNTYKCQTYKQKNGLNFVPNLSIIDVVANCGWIESATYVRN